MKNKITTLAAALLLTAATVDATEGLNLIGVGPVQQGTAGAGVASAKDSSWLILNPAGLTDIERGANASFQIFAPDRSINSTFSAGAGEQRDDSIFYIPALSTSFGCCHGDDGYLGIGLYGTSGMGVDYTLGRVGADTNFDTFPDTPQGQVDQLTELAIAKLTVTYARKFDNGFSFGAGPVFVYSRFRTDMLNSSFVPQSGKWDEAVGIGAIVGVNQKINDRLTVGASYISEQFLTEFDEYNNLLADSLNLPQQLTVGLAYKLRDDLEVVTDYRWVGWSKLSTIGDQFGWDDQHIVKAGLTWDATERLTLRGGISHGNSPISSDSAFANALFPAIVQTHASCGASVAFEKFSLDLAYTHAFDESITATGFGAGTEISMHQNSLTVGLNWPF
jgi:long-chain fatty acid transport protein